MRLELFVKTNVMYRRKCVLTLLYLDLLIRVHGGGPHYCTPNHEYPCLNGATCKPYNNGYNFDCDCVEGYKGDTCALIDCSSPIYCLNGGTCHEVNGGLAKSCTCYYGWKGGNCEEIDECTPYQEADFVFVIDASLSVANAGLEHQKTYIKNFISKFKDGPLNYRFQFSAVTYSLNATVHFHLNEYADFTQLESAVDNVDHENYGPSMTGEALRVVREEVLAPGNGVRLDKDAYVLLLTDGLSSDPVETLYQATQLKVSGVRLYTIGTGNQINQKEIVEVASFNSYAYPMATDDALHHVLSYTMFGCQECSEHTSDVALVMDISSHIDAIALETQLQAANYLIKKANISPDDVQFSYQTFSDNVYLVNDFDDFHEAGGLIAEINFRTHIHKGRSRNITAALEYLINNGFDVAKGARPDTRKIVVLFTSGNFTDDLQTEKVTAQRLKDDDVIIVVVGVDLKSDVHDLVAISSDPAFTYFIGEDIDVPVSVLGGLLSTITYKRCSHFQ